MTTTKQAMSELYRTRRALHSAAVDLLASATDDGHRAQARKAFSEAFRANGQAAADLAEAQEREDVERGTSSTLKH